MTNRIPDRAPLTTDTTSTTPITTTPSSVRAGPIPTFEITSPDTTPLVRATAHAAQPLLHPATASHHVPNAMSTHAVESTPAPKSAAELFKNKIESENLRHKGDLEAADQKMKDYERDVSNLTIKRVALAIITPILLVALVASVFALASIIPPIGAGVGAGLVIGLTMGLAYGGTGLACAIITGAILLDPDDPDEPEMPQDQRDQLNKNLKNTNTAMELFEKYPKDRTNPNGSSYEEFLDTLPALTTDGVRSYELDQLDKYNNLFSKKVKLQKLNDAPKLIREVQKAENDLRALGVLDPKDASSIQNRIDALAAEIDVLAAEFQSPIEITSGSDDEIEMGNVGRDENKEAINSLKEQINSIKILSSRLTELRQESAEANNIFTSESKDSLENEIKTDKETLAKAIAEKQKQIDQGQPDREIEALNKELRTTKQAYLNQLESSNIPEDEFSERIEQNEQSVLRGTTKIRELQGKITALTKANPQLQRSPTRTKTEVDTHIASLDAEIDEVKKKLADNGLRDPLAENAIKNRILEIRQEKEKGYKDLQAMKAEIAKLNETRANLLKNTQTSPDELKKIDDSLEAQKAKLSDMEDVFEMFDEQEKYDDYQLFGSKQITELEDLSRSLEKLLKEKKFETATLEIINLNAQIAGLTAVQTRLESEISELNSVIANQNKIVEIGRKIEAVKNKKQIQDLNTKSEQLETKLEELKGKADKTRDDYTKNRIIYLKNEIVRVRNNTNKAEISSTNDDLKKLESAINILTEEADYRSQVNNRYTEFKENHSKLSPEVRKSRLEGAAWKETEESKYYEAEKERIKKLIQDEEEKKLKDSQYSLHQGSLYPQFTEKAKLQHLDRIAFMEKERYLQDLKGPAQTG